MPWVLDTTNSCIEFSVKHMMVSTVRGRFGTFQGTVQVDEANPLNSSAEGSVDVATIDTRDGNRDGHLRSADFFDAEKYPHMTFRTTHIEKVDAEHFNVIGDITLKGVTQPITFEVTHEGRSKDPWGNQRMGLSATAKLNRKDFGLSWNMALETGGWALADQVKITIDLELVNMQTQPAATA